MSIPTRKILRKPRIAVALFVLIFIGAITFLSPWIWPYDPSLAKISERICPMSSAHILGCDLNGNDVLRAVLNGGRVSLIIGLITVGLSMTIGTFLGLISGYYGGKIDQALMRLVDILLAFPGILLALVLASVLGPNIYNVILSISATGWISTARIVRGQSLSLKHRDFVVAAKSLGARDASILFKHMLPQIVPFIIIQATFSLSGVILIEASLSFLGITPTTNVPTWGALLSQGKSVLSEAPHLTLVPGFMISLVILSLNFLGDGLRDVMDPRNN